MVQCCAGSPCRGSVTARGICSVRAAGQPMHADRAQEGVLRQAALRHKVWMLCMLHSTCRRNPPPLPGDGSAGSQVKPPTRWYSVPARCWVHAGIAVSLQRCLSLKASDRSRGTRSAEHREYCNQLFHRFSRLRKNQHAVGIAQRIGGGCVGIGLVVFATGKVRLAYHHAGTHAGFERRGKDQYAAVFIIAYIKIAGRVARDIRW